MVYSSISTNFNFVKGGPLRNPVEGGFKISIVDLYVCKYLVSQEEWKKVMGSLPDACSDRDDRKPIYGYSDNQRDEFISKVSLRDGKKYRLLKEEEWEYVAKGGDCDNGHIYPGSNDIAKVACFSNTSQDKLGWIGMNMPNEQDIYDMAGLLWEETSSLHNGGKNTIVKGGAYNCSKEYCQIEKRFPYIKGTFQVGLRLCYDANKTY